jgi:hypothetical protein
MPDEASDTGPAKKPKVLKKARAAGADDLKQIKGIGKVLEDKLHALGVYHFDQIAAWTRRGSELGRRPSFLQGTHPARRMDSAGQTACRGDQSMTAMLEDKDRIFTNIYGLP